MPKPVRIIIDIKDEETFDWDGAHALWKRFFRAGTSGHNTGSMSYVWRKEIPSSQDTRFPSGNDGLAELREEIDAVRRAVYRIKSTAAPVDSDTLKAMTKATRTLYSRWSAIDANTALVGR